MLTEDQLVIYKNTLEFHYLRLCDDYNHGGRYIVFPQYYLHTLWDPVYLNTVQLIILYFCGFSLVFTPFSLFAGPHMMFDIGKHIHVR